MSNTSVISMDSKTICIFRPITFAEPYPNQPHQQLFALLPSGRRYRALWQKEWETSLIYVP